jgi:hypothetical protein
MVTVNVARGTAVTAFALLGMMLGMHVQDSERKRHEAAFDSRVEQAFSSALAARTKKVEALEASVRQLKER